MDIYVSGNRTGMRPSRRKAGTLLRVIATADIATALLRIVLVYAFAVVVHEPEAVRDLDDAQRARLMEIATRCPVHRTLTSEIRIRTSAA